MKKLTFLLIAALLLTALVSCDHDSSMSLTEDEKAYRAALKQCKGSDGGSDSLDGVWFGRGGGFDHYIVIDGETVQFIKYRGYYITSGVHDFEKSGDRYAAEYSVGRINKEYYRRTFWLNGDRLEYDDEKIEMRKEVGCSRPDTTPTRFYEVFRATYSFSGLERVFCKEIKLYEDGTFEWKGETSGTFEFDNSPFEKDGVRYIGKLVLTTAEKSGLGKISFNMERCGGSAEPGNRFSSVVLSDYRTFLP